MQVYRQRCGVFMVIAMLLLVVWSVPKAKAQTCPNLIPAQPCSQLNAGIVSCTGSQNFCIGDSVCLTNVSTGIVDSAFICWGDGSATVSYTGNPNQPFKHHYNYRSDSCVTDGFLELDFVMYLYQNCPAPTLVGKVPYPIYIKFKPKAKFTFGNDTICKDENVSILIPGDACTNTSLNNPPGAIITWDFGDGTIIVDTSYTINPPQHSYAVSGNYTITLTIKNTCGTSSISHTVFVKPSLTFQSAVAPDTCVAFPYAFIPVVHTEHVYGFTWSSTNGSMTFQLPNDSVPNILVTAPGTYPIHLHVEGCCYAPATCDWDTTVIFNQGPTFIASGNLAACDSTDLDASTIFNISDPSNTISAYHWSFPGGTPASSTAANPGFIHYGSPGNYPLSLVVNSTCGPDSISDTLRIGAPPQLNVTANPLLGCGSLVVHTNNTSPAGQTYQWTSPLATSFSASATVPAPDITYSSTGIFPLTVTASTPGCPSIQQAWSVEVDPAPTLLRVATIVGNCDSSFTIVFPSYYNLVPASSDSGYLWTVTNQAGTILYSNTSANPPSYNPNNFGTYYVEALAWNFCDSIILRDTFMLVPPATLLLPSDTTVCHSNPALQLNASPAGGNWTFNGTNLGGAIVNPATYTTVTNTAVYTYGVATCETKDSLTVTIVGANVDAGTNKILCGNSGSFSLIGTPSGGSWSGNGIVNNSGLYDPSLLAPGNAVAYYTVTDGASGCVTIDSLSITLLGSTAATINLPDTTCTGTAENFSNTTAGTTTVWTFGDGSAQGINNTEIHSYTNSGVYPVVIEITSANGCKDTLYDTVVVNIAPTGSFVIAVDTGCAPLAESFINTSSGNAQTSYIWNFGNGTTDTIFSPPNMTYLQGLGDSTLYTIQLQAVNACGSSSYQKTIIVYPIPVADFQVDRSEYCSPDTVSFSNITTGAPQYYQWYVNGVFVTADSLLLNQVFMADSTDTLYHVMLIAGNKCGVDTIVRTVLVHPSSVAPFFNIDHPWGCRPLTVTFTSSVRAQSNVWWNLGDGNTAFGDTITHTYDSTGTFVVWQYVDNICGYDSVRQVVTTFDHPPVSFTVPAVNCGNEPVQFTNTSFGTIGQVWNFGDGSLPDSSHTSPLHLYPAPGIYSASLLAYATGTACEDSIRKFVVVKSYPTAGLSIPNNAGCPPITLDLIADNLSSAAIRYIWDMGNGDSLFGTPTSYTYNQSGNFTVTLTAIDNNNCKDDTSFSYVNVYPEQTPQASFTPRPGSQTILTPTIQFDNTTFSGINYEWSFGDGKTGYDPSPSHTYPAIGEYVVQLIAQNHFGCVDTAIDTVYIYPEISVYVPNAFTPSGRNPYFLPRFADLDPTSYSFIICNRWGEKVFETNDPKQGWDGTYKGADAEVGVYVYVITTRSIQVGNKQENVSKRGTVTLLR